jgi:glycosyltransferase involved in cell wall biosynthesis
MGRLAAIKRVDVLIEAFRTVAVANPELLLVIAGDGEQAGKLRERARGTNRIQFVGVVSGDDKVWLLQNALGLVLPSQVETFGLAALEAFAGGIPVVGTRVGGLAELIKPGVNGFLTNADDAAALARSLDELINSGGRLPRMRQGARETASHYAWNAVARQYLHVLESVVVPNCPRPADASRAT